MPGLQYTAANGINSYRYSFNGKEDDADITNGGQDYGMRIYDKRVARFLSVDPITAKYPELTSYQFASNRPIDGIDQDGLEWYPPYKTDKKTGKMVPDGDAAIKIHTDPRNAIVIPLVIDAFVTKGWLTRLYITSEFFNAFPHNRPKTEEARREQHKESMQHLSNAIVAWGAGRFLDKVSSLVAQIPSVRNIQTKLVHSNEVNASFNKKGWYSPYKENVTLAEVNLTEEVPGLVRLLGPNNIEGNWFTTMSEIRGLTPAQLKDKFALKYAPTNMTPASLNGPVRVGEAAKVPEFDEGGGFQIEALPGSQVKYGKTVPLH